MSSPAQPERPGDPLATPTLGERRDLPLERATESETSGHYLLFIPLWEIGFKFLPLGDKEPKQVDLAGGCVESAVMGKKIISCRGSVGRERELGTAMLSAAAGKAAASPRDGKRQTPSEGTKALGWGGRTRNCLSQGGAAGL